MNLQPHRLSKEKSPAIMTTQKSHWKLLILALTTTLLLGTGCVTNGRRILLKEYGPSIPAAFNQNLNGLTICVNNLTCAPNLISLEPQSQPEEPANYKYLDFNPEQDRGWNQEMQELRKKTKETTDREIGNMRNGFGMVMSHVFALNDPGTWLADSLKSDLESQGAKVVDAYQSASADLTISGRIELCKVDMYLMMSGNLVVDLELQPKLGTARHLLTHTHGGTVAMLASEGEYFHALRECRQKLSIILSHELAQTRK